MYSAEKTASFINKKRESGGKKWAEDLISWSQSHKGFIVS